MFSCLAPAKLNLFLHITSRREDGYHCLQTVFQFLDYHDVLYFDVRRDGQLRYPVFAQPWPIEQDLIFRAAQLLQQYSGTSLGADIYVDKKIPVGGGLGGGSSNAATTLLALNQLWQLHLSKEILTQIGLSLGADVPIFLYGHTAWAEGIGEKLTALELDEPWYLVIYPGCSVSTREIFTDPALTRDTLPIKISTFLAGQTTNVCEPIVRSRYPAVDQAMKWLDQYRPSRLTGTGSCLFARFEQPAEAQAVLANLPEIGYGFVAQGRNVSPALKCFAEP
ncbi:4-diphosphocytidyl-2C-methyl-D-erythritol kinase [Thioploca ingrica]|uniref:4-diphosphocytidyl-2-C-methyl-D-erythritol kinase n=1 Tax=Thioploca ingrica TaxID=40754 RepID=A0A090BVC3_9GAMM|nr:4-diphosphocytidyl-2C-methyl-D-erythritol kinase [Thioploca ingrica]